MEKSVRVFPAECICGDFFILRVPEKYDDVPLDEALNLMIAERNAKAVCQKCRVDNIIK